MRELREIYRAKKYPVLQNRMYKTSEEALACPQSDIVLVQDMGTGLIFNQAFLPELVEYGPEYQNEQAFSSVFRGHLDEVTKVIHRHLNGKTLLEIGCGKGQFLEHLHSMGFNIVGLDPAYEGTSPMILKELFNPSFGLTAEGIVLRHVLEHVADPLGFLSDIRNANGGSGIVYIEVPCYDWIVSHRAWFDIYYEYVNYFRLDDFRRMFGVVFEVGHVFGGQYLYVVADMATLRIPKYTHLCKAEFPPGFLEKVTVHAQRLNACNAGKSAIWGGRFQRCYFFFTDAARRSFYRFGYRYQSGKTR